MGFTGGINLADEYINKVERFGHWKDTSVLLRGAAVRSLTRMFLQQWTLNAGSDTLDRPEEEYLTARALPAQGYVQPYPDSPWITLMRRRMPICTSSSGRTIMSISPHPTSSWIMNLSPP